jgi:hypothetical protein
VFCSAWRVAALVAASAATRRSTALGMMKQVQAGRRRGRVDGVEGMAVS